MMNKKEIVFVLGASKTGTTAMTRMLNAHPDIFILFESSIGMSSQLDKYTARFLGTYPDSRPLFSYGVTPDVFYPRLQNFLANKGYPFKILGTDAPLFGINAKPIEILSQYQVVYMIRNIRTWLAKNATIAEYFTDNDIVCLAIDYTIAFLKSFLLPRALKVRMEDIIRQNDTIIDALSSFLDVPMRPYLDEWWKVSFSKGHPKLAQQWIETHLSGSFGPRGVEDTEVKLASHPFWDQFLPIFDTYFQDPNIKVDEKVILADIERLKALKRFSPLGLKETYFQFKTIQLYPREHLRKKITKQIGKEFKRARGMLKLLMRELFK